jgi:hypothetical protein
MRHTITKEKNNTHYIDYQSKDTLLMYLEEDNLGHLCQVLQSHHNQIDGPFMKQVNTLEHNLQKRRVFFFFSKTKSFICKQTDQ